MVIFGSCASSQAQPRSLKNRSLRIDADLPRFIYQYKVCAGRIFKKCAIKTDYYDFADPIIRLKLKTMGFKLSVKR